MTIAGVNPVVQGNSSPLATCGIDPTSGLVYSPGCCNYTPINTAGTTTIKSNGGIFYGFNAVTAGTSYTISPYDIYVNVSGTTTTTTTNQLFATSTASISPTGAVVNVTAGGGGIRFNGQLACVTAGTPGLWNVLWD